MRTRVVSVAKKTLFSFVARPWDWELQGTRLNVYFSIFNYVWVYLQTSQIINPESDRNYLVYQKERRNIQNGWENRQQESSKSSAFHQGTWFACCWSNTTHKPISNVPMYKAPGEMHAGGSIKEVSIHHISHAKAADIQTNVNGIKNVIQITEQKDSRGDLITPL